MQSVSAPYTHSLLVDHMPRDERAVCCLSRAHLPAREAIVLPRNVNGHGSSTSSAEVLKRAMQADALDLRTRHGMSRRIGARAHACVGAPDSLVCCTYASGWGTEPQA